MNEQANGLTEAEWTEIWRSKGDRDIIERILADRQAALQRRIVALADELHREAVIAGGHAKNSIDAGRWGALHVASARVRGLVSAASGRVEV